MNELVSVVISAYNHEKFVGSAIESIFRQDYRPLQIIISDDASRDGTRAAIAAKLLDIPADISVILSDSDTNMGLAGSLNRICPLAAGRIVVMLAGDDIAEPNRVRLTLEAFRANADTQMVWSDYSMIDEEGRILRDNSGLSSQAGTYGMDDYFSGKAPPILGATCAYSSDIFRNFQPLQPDVIQEDLVFPLRCFILGKGVFLNVPLVRYRTHAGNVHFGGFNQSSKQLASRVIRLGPNRLAVARQKLDDIAQAALLGRPFPECLKERLALELRAAEIELHIAQGATFLIRGWRLLCHVLAGGFPLSFAGRIFLLYVTPFAYLSVLNAKIWLTRARN